MVRKKSNTGPKMEVKHIPTNKSKCTCEQVALALDKCNGQVYLTADYLDVNPITIQRYMRKWPILKQVRKRCWGRRLDMIEDTLVGKALNGDIRAMLRILAAWRGKRWGRKDKVKVQGVGDITINNNQVLAPQITEDTKNKLIEEVRKKQVERRKQLDSLNKLEIGFKEIPVDKVEPLTVERPAVIEGEVVGRGDSVEVPGEKDKDDVE